MIKIYIVVDRREVPMKSVCPPFDDYLKAESYVVVHLLKKMPRLRDKTEFLLKEMAKLYVCELNLEHHNFTGFHEGLCHP